MDREITIDDVLQFIREKGHLYDYDIYRELEKIQKIKPNIKKELDKNKDLYERLSKL